MYFQTTYLILEKLVLLYLHTTYLRAPLLSSKCSYAACDNCGIHEADNGWNEGDKWHGLLLLSMQNRVVSLLVDVRVYLSTVCNINNVLIYWVILSEVYFWQGSWNGNYTIVINVLRYYSGNNIRWSRLVFIHYLLLRGCAE